MRKASLLLVLSVLVVGCVSKGVGSRYWHDGRMAEIETAYKENKLTTSEYLQLKTEADQVRATRNSKTVVNTYRPSTY